MFESGDWKDSEDEDSESDEDEEAEESRGAWNLEAMRKETERLRQQKEEDRLAELNGAPTPDTNSADTESSKADDDSQEGDG